MFPAGFRAYSAARLTLASPNATAIRGNLDFVTPTVCAISGAQTFSQESLSICWNGNCDGFVQVGWTRFRQYPQSMGWCEYQGLSGDHHSYVWDILAQTQQYRMQWTSTGWECWINNVRRGAGVTTGFNGGSYMPVQGETNSQDSQIGRNAPGKFLFDFMLYRNGSYLTLNVVPFSPNSPYGNDEPTAGDFRNWTNAH